MDILLKSIAAGIITAVILLTERFSGPKISGIIAGVPIIFVISFVIITSQTKDMTTIREVLIGGILGGLGGVVFCFALWFLNARFMEYYWLNIIAAYAACFLFAFGMMQFLGRS